MDQDDPPQSQARLWERIPQQEQGAFLLGSEAAWLERQSLNDAANSLLADQPS